MICHEHIVIKEIKLGFEVNCWVFLVTEDHDSSTGLHGCSRLGTATSSSFGQSLLIQISPSFSITEVRLSLTKFGQIQCSNFLSFFNLFFVCLNLSLKLIH